MTERSPHKHLWEQPHKGGLRWCSVCNELRGPDDHSAEYAQNWKKSREDAAKKKENDND